MIELKLGSFKPADAGQVQLYLRWLDRQERQPGEDAPLAIILCAGKKRETVENETSAMASAIAGTVKAAWGANARQF